MPYPYDDLSTAFPRLKTLIIKADMMILQPWRSKQLPKTIEKLGFRVPCDFRLTTWRGCFRWIRERDVQKTTPRLAVIRLIGYESLRNLFPHESMLSLIKDEAATLYRATGVRLEDKTGRRIDHLFMAGNPPRFCESSDIVASCSCANILMF